MSVAVNIAPRAPSSIGRETGRALGDGGVMMERAGMGMASMGMGAPGMGMGSA